MICSFTLNLKPLLYGIRIRKYSNYHFIEKILKLNGIDDESLKKIVITNFITKDKFFEEKNYSIKISSIDSEVTLKILRIFFLLKLEGDLLEISGNKFILLNIHYSNINSRQLLLENIEYKEKIEINYLTPCVFKFGSRFINSFEPLYVFSNLLVKLKRSSLKNNSDFFISKNEISQIKYEIISSKTLNISSKKTTGLVGKVIYYVENNKELNKKINNILAFAFFSGIGYCTQEGYGQIN